MTFGYFDYIAIDTFSDKSSNINKCVKCFLYLLKYVNKKHPHSLKADFSLKHLKKQLPPRWNNRKTPFRYNFLLMKKIMSHIIQIINDESLSIIISLFVSYFFWQTSKHTAMGTSNLSAIRTRPCGISFAQNKLRILGVRPPPFPGRNQLSSIQRFQGVSKHLT